MARMLMKMEVRRVAWGEYRYFVFCFCFLTVLTTKTFRKFLCLV